ncbi:MAG: DAK2 domain-containing protein, partial [Oscillospiraceae bacterium]|nr:DAK2 domain-containing protein [Oscillospiraceae bacterium]
KPAEGTVLTVSRLAAARAVEAATEHNDPIYVLEQAIRAGETTLAETIEMNPVLKKAGVVDAGGKGYLVILEGMLRCLKGEPMPELNGSESRTRADFDALSQEDITFTFDTVFIVRKTKGPVDLQPLRLYLTSIGDSLVIGEDDDAFKVHVHTDIPGNALNEAQKYGDLEVAKIENMRIQAQDVAAGRKTISADDLEDEDEPHGESAAQEVTFAPAEKKIGFLAVCAGDGIADTFRALGVDTIVSGGQTMNPSTEAILAEVNRTPSEVVFVLPNNKNIIMAAQQCQGLTEKRVVVIPTATVPQGITAMMALDPEDEDVDSVTAVLTEAAATVSTAQITYAARDSEFDGFAITEGDYLALIDGKLFDTDRDLNALLEKLAAYAKAGEKEYINIYAGDGVSDADAAAAEELFAEKSGAEVASVRGGQPVYYYIISME